jgi:Mn-dependent DtxR family transcriptional regulator
MRTVEVVGTLAPLLSAGSVLLLATRRRLIRTFEQAEATSASRAIHIQPRRPLGPWWLHKLQRHGVVIATPAGTYWLNQDGWRAYHAIRRRRGLLVVAVVLVLGAVYLLRSTP